jgi:hypothetical protein
VPIQQPFQRRFVRCRQQLQRRITMSRYAWVIVQDCNDPYGESEFPPRARGTRVGVSGPASATPGEMLHALRHGAFFRLVDADGHVSYIGRCWAAAGPDSEEMFGPLDDYGRADAAATEIQYRIDGDWQPL